ncbi:hypothetical protein [Aquibacillus sediminis]|uniref:hypothetical protein n=1 Tax=Aquibacillus sediminis TaxID=2574734 RepID=UPI0011083DF1|nr:hypothetical protein [Aquibacillus sediminis]
MKIVRFDRSLWALSSFEDVSYDKKESVFKFYLFNGNIIEFSDVPEKVVFDFVISANKEKFYKNVLLTNYPYIQYNHKVSKTS